MNEVTISGGTDQMRAIGGEIRLIMGINPVLNPRDGGSVDIRLHRRPGDAHAANDRGYAHQGTHRSYHTL